MAPFSNTVELDSSSLLSYKSTSKPGINSYDYSIDDSSVPQMIMSSSLQSFGESDSDSLSSSIRSMNRAQSPMGASPTSPRSIFKTYWSSPSRKDNSKDDQDELLARLQTLQLPLDGGDNDAKVVHQRPIASSAIEYEQKKKASSLDDASISYQAPPTSPSARARRQILPTPPPMTAISSSLIMPRRQLMATQHGSNGLRQWKSTTALMPNQSCLRKSRYSCSAIVASEATAVGREGKLHQGLRNSGCHDLTGGQQPQQQQQRRPRAVSDVSDLKKSVSFYSQVSVFEFAPEQKRSQKGWSKYFA